MFTKVILILLTLIMATSPHSAIAVEQLNYNVKISPSLKYQINLLLEEIYDTDISLYDMANIDLNNDGVDEHILKRKACDASKSQCMYSIVAEKNDKIILLSKIRAKNIIVGETSSHGVKDLLVFQNEINDYNFNIYVWSPPQKMYIIDVK